MTLTIGIDLGTSAVRAALIEGAHRVRCVATRPIAVSIAHVGWSEQDPECWVAAMIGCLHDLARAEPALMQAVNAIGLSGQMLCALVLDKSHKPLRPAILWNDQRAIAECADLLAACPDIGMRTNGTPDPGMTAPNLLWLRKHEPRLMDAAAMLLLTKDYVRLALTGDLATEPTDAGGTQLLNVATGQWDDDLGAHAGWDPAHLPPLLKSWDNAGGLRPVLAQRWGMRPGIAVATGAGDNMGATRGGGAATPGAALSDLLATRKSRFDALLV